ncbi:unnamed protein product [Chironomus riparius]|uniref:Glucuronosyltransferase n=1 Tax=Chironomus riparius TaxID=315576 RepID=A0A9N9RIZ0_9DIPT|nr:unnamed protein product [Chironomus riparius]
MNGNALGIFILIVIASIDCSRILFVQPSMSKSHVMPLQTLAKDLAKRGHEITFLSIFPFDKKIENYRDIKLEVKGEYVNVFEEVGKAISEGAGLSKMIPLMNKMIYGFGNETIQSPTVQKIMNEDQFDLVVVGYFVSEFLLGFADHFNCPSIIFSSGNHVASLNFIVGNPLSPDGTFGDVTDSAVGNFINKVKIFLVYTIQLAVFKGLLYYRSKSIYDYNFPPDRYRSYDEMIRNVSLVLVNTHFTSSGPRPLLPNLVEVGGLQVKPNPAPLPEDLKTFLDDAKDGAILFSFGSNAKSIYIPEDKQKIILKVFSKLKQRVIMKWESDVLPGKPKNVLISKWLPQDDILAHPNIKAFISHCGYGGVIEAKSNGVPIIGIPLGADQKGNADKIVEEGWAVRLDMTDITEESLTNALKEILSNPKYRDIVGKQAILAKDRPMNAQDTAVYWVEYVLRHNGAPHLHYPGADLNFFQANSIDVILFIFAVIYAAFKVIKLICGFIFCRSKKGSNEKLKRN